MGSLIGERPLSDYIRLSMNDAVFCAQIVARHARTFALASRLLPREKRRGAYAVYAFCRTADDIVDLATRADQAPAADRLAAYRNAVDGALGGTASSPVLRELAWAVSRFAIPKGCLDTLLTGVAADLETPRYQTWDDLREYCRGVASSVGEMCAAVFGIEGDARVVDRALAHARTLGVAMQLTNILRDVGEDARRGRCYLPEEDLRRFDLSAADVLTGTAMEAGGSWAALMRFEIARARELYRDALPGIRLVAADARRCALACASGYAGILTAIERNAYDTFTRRASVPNLDRANILLRSWLNRFPEFAAGSEPPNGAPRPSHA